MHPGEALREEFVKPYELCSAEHLDVPANRISECGEA